MFTSRDIKMFVCRNFCLCMDLRKGCIAIAYFQAVQQLLLMIYTLRALFEDFYFFKTCSKALYEESSFMLAYSKAVHLFLHTLYLILTCSLLVGLHKGISRIIKDYLICVFIYMVFYALLYLLAWICLDDFEIEGVGPPINLTLNIYFLLMMRSYWLKMYTKQSLSVNA
ncbi:PREDICTED: uncharacterized protein LOC106101622 [Papilio polytes]|uniref:uncharacterized protein LOC106101622 n=1 Tax=Papilio polytes TaxID=76194 RepID=UPI000675CF61|nr:PREDICTED: uncharacterized protein LOC106101622 [Papilio polytes]